MTLRRWRGLGMIIRRERTRLDAMKDRSRTVDGLCLALPHPKRRVQKRRTKRWQQQIRKQLRQYRDRGLLPWRRRSLPSFVRFIGQSMTVSE